MPASGRDFDSRLPATSVVTFTVSPSNSGAGNLTSVMPRLAMVVPTVVSLTEIPIISPRVKSEFMSGRAPFRLGRAEMRVDVQGLRVQRHVGEQHVVHLGHRPRQAVPDGRRRRRNPRNRCPPRGCRASVCHHGRLVLGVRRFQASFTITVQCRRPGRSSRQPSRPCSCSRPLRPAQPRQAVPVVDAIRQGAERTGVAFDYLLSTAQRESALDPTARARNFVGERPLPVHRADLARAHQERGREGRACRLCQGGLDPLRRDPSRSTTRPAPGDPRTAAGSAGRLRHGRRAHPEEPRGAHRRTRPRAFGGDLYAAHFLGRAAPSTSSGGAPKARPGRSRRNFPRPRPRTARSSSTGRAARGAPARSTPCLAQSPSGAGAAPAFAPGPPRRLRQPGRSGLPWPVPERDAARARLRGGREALARRRGSAGRSRPRP